MEYENPCSFFFHFSFSATLFSLKNTCQVYLDIAEGIHSGKNKVKKEEKIDLIICNPPFHSSIEDAQKSTLRKLRNLSDKKVKNNHLKFAGLNNEIIFEGGEIKFIENIINESKLYAKNCYWFSTLVSKQSNLKKTYKLIDKTGPYFVKTIPMGTGNKAGRIVAWTYLSKEAQNKWRDERWQ